MFKLSTNKLVKILALFSGSVALLLLLAPSPAVAAFTKQINYQGKLTNAAGAAVADGTYSMVFTFYTAPSGGSVIWTETQSVTVTSGLFSVMLGSVSSLDAIDFNQVLYLGLNVNGDGEMSPRKVLGSVPNSFNTLNFDGLATTSFLRADIANATGSINYLTVSGNMTAGSITLNGVTRTTWPGGGSGTDVNWSYNPLTNTLTPATSTSNVFVNGTSSLSSTTINGYLGIGTTNPLFAVDVSGGQIKSNNTFDSGTYIYSGSMTTGKSWTDPIFGNIYAGVYGYATDTKYDFNTADYSSVGVFGRSDYGVGVVGIGSNGGIFAGSDVGIYSALGRNIFADDVILGAGLKDNSDQYGFTGNVLLSTGSGVSWTGDINASQSINVSPGFYYNYNNERIFVASTTLKNYSFGPSGNLSMTGSNNLSFGNFALNSNMTGSGNIAMGSYSLISNQSGSDNISIGGESLNKNTNGNKNISIGTLSLLDSTSGSGNIAIGAYAGSGAGGNPDYRSVVDNYSLFLGYNATRDMNVSSSTSLLNATAIGYNAKVGASNSLILGGTNGYSVKVGIGTSTPDSILTIVASSSDSNILRIATSSGGQNIFSINNLGQVGIGTNVFSNSSEVLSVIGSTMTTGLIKQETNDNFLQMATSSTVALPGVGSGSVDIKIFGNYAYLVFQQNDNETDGLRILDISDPINPTIVGGDSLILPKSSRKVDADGKYVYVSSETGYVSVIDVTNPKNPILVSNLYLGPSVRDLKIVGKYLYAALYAGEINATTTNTFAVIDVSNHKNPRVVAGTDLQLPGHCRGLDVNNGFVYLTYYASSTDKLFRVIDVRDPLNPVVASSYHEADFPYWGRGVSAAGNYVYLASGGWGTDTLNPLATSTFFRIIDVSDPYNPIQVGGKNIEFNTIYGVNSLFQVKITGHYAHVVGGYTYRILDISDPTNPRVIAKKDSGDLSVWAMDVKGNYAYTVNNSLNSTKILQIYKIGGLEASSVYSGFVDTGHLNVLGDVVSAGNAKIFGSLNVGLGGIFSSGGIGVEGDGNFQLTATSSLAISNINSGGVGGIDFPILIGHSYTSNLLGLDLNNLGIADRLGIIEQDGLSNLSLGFYDSSLTSVATINVSTTTGAVVFDDATSWAFNTLNSNGTVYSNNGVLTNVNPSSLEYKINVADASLNIDALLGLQVKNFTWKSNSQNDFGLIAEDIKAALPELYLDDGVTKGYRADHLPFYLLQIAQRQEKRIVELDNRIASGTISTSFASSSIENLNLGSIQSIAGNWSISIDGTIVVKKVQADTICLGQTCFDENKLKELLSRNGLLTPVPGPVVSDPVIATSTAPTTTETLVAEPPTSPDSSQVTSSEGEQAPTETSPAPATETVPVAETSSQ